MPFTSRTLSILFLLLLGPRLWALEIPEGLTQNDLGEVIDTLGIETSAKFLSDPYSLGGHSGFEIGISSEFIDASDLARLGDGTARRENTFQYNRLTFGKGLYHDFDLFIHFVPYSSANEISEYGATAKWMFYEAKRLPVTISMLGYANTLNIEDRFINESIGWDIMSGLNLRNFAVYFGAGSVNARSTFNQVLLDAALNASLNEEKTYIVKSQQAHSMVGLQARMGSIFVATQIDRYEHPVYSAKVGVRF